MFLLYDTLHFSVIDYSVGTYWKKKNNLDPLMETNFQKCFDKRREVALVAFIFYSSLHNLLLVAAACLQ